MICFCIIKFFIYQKKEKTIQLDRDKELRNWAEKEVRSGWRICANVNTISIFSILSFSNSAFYLAILASKATNLSI